jgi:hypothetical protein
MESRINMRGDSVMKKKFLWGALVVALAFGFMGCPTDDEDSSSSPFQLMVTGNMATGITRAIVRENASSGNIAAATNSNGVFRFFKTSSATSMAPTINAWEGGGSYSLVLSTTVGDKLYLYTAGKELTADGAMTTKFDFTGKNGSVAWDQFKEMEPEPTTVPFTLTVSGEIPSGIVGAAVRESLAPEATILAVAMKSNGVFHFYTPDFTIPAMPIPSRTPWEGTGSHFLVLSTITGTQHLYTAGLELTTGGVPNQEAYTKKFDFTNGTGTANISDFKQLP